MHPQRRRMKKSRQSAASSVQFVVDNLPFLIAALPLSCLTA
jgi:hypothetical protein